MDEKESNTRLAELAETERALWTRVGAGDPDATEECAAVLYERDSLLNPVTDRVPAVDDEQRERHRRDLLLAYARIETVLLAQEQTPDIVRQLAETRRLLDNLGTVEVVNQGVPEEWLQEMLAGVDELDRKARDGSAAGLDCVELFRKIEMLRLEVLAARRADEVDEGPK